MEIKYSIIVPHYNTSDYLSKLLSTIPKRSEIQVLVIDDNSTIEEEKLRQVIKDDDRCEFYTNTTGIQSAGACRNIGLSHALGKWIIFADADDYFTDEFVKSLNVYYNSPVDLVYFTPTSIYLGTQKKTGRHILYEGLIYEYQRKSNTKNELNLRYRFCCPVSKMIKRDMIQKNDIVFEQTPVANDIVFNTKVGFYTKSFEVTDKIIYCITKSRNTLTTTVKEEYFDTRLDVLIRRYGFLREHLSRKEIRKLDITGQLVLYEALTKFGVKKFFKTVNRLLANGVKLYSFSTFNLKMSARSLVDRVFSRI